jgi:hypothetical protein
MQGLTDSLRRSTISPKAVIATGSQTLGTATLAGGNAATVCFSVSSPICPVYTDPEGKTEDYDFIIEQEGKQQLHGYVPNNDGVPICYRK